MNPTCVIKENKFRKLQKEQNISESSLENILKGWLDKDHEEID